MAQVVNPEFKEEIFGVHPRPHLLHQAVVMQQANRRAGSAATKSKGFVRGGGKKPWRQKGTGRARSGSIRSPIWVGGGTIFGPAPREALLSALSLKHKEGKIIVLASFDFAEPKTKLARQLLEELQVKSALIVLPENDAKVMLSVRNLPKVKALRVDGLNVYDLLRYEHLILTEQALRAIEERLAA